MSNLINANFADKLFGNFLLITKIDFNDLIRLVFKSHYDLHKNFYQYLLHLDQLKEFFHNLVTLTDHMGHD
ncbi:hypothetical protein BpHYR1_019083 [Brachionus plicatilis]|uniref:Uncharacterized protein n=1 Tax=Brachionus plicatilis TaxID=10195 RepID=A0A3M7RZP2_BRAPC|nr:hypothetical protein BpHYR1_019083 [Brachionus plicatilis]